MSRSFHAILQSCSEQFSELAVTVFVHADDLSIHHQTARHESIPDSGGKLCERCERMTVAGIESTAPVFNDGKRSEAVVLQLKQISRIIEWERLTAQRLGWKTSISA